MTMSRIVLHVIILYSASFLESASSFGMTWQSSSSGRVGGNFTWICNMTGASPAAKLTIVKYQYDLDLYKFITEGKPLHEVHEIDEHNKVEINHEETVVLQELRPRYSVSIDTTATSKILKLTVNNIEMMDQGYWGCIGQDGDQTDTTNHFFNVSGSEPRVELLLDSQPISDEGGITLNLTNNTSNISCGVHMANAASKVRMSLLDGSTGSSFDVTYMFPLDPTDISPVTVEPFAEEIGVLNYKNKNSHVFSPKDNGKIFRCLASASSPVVGVKTASVQAKLYLNYSPEDMTCPDIVYTPVGQTNVEIPCSLMANPEPDWALTRVDGGPVTGITSRDKFQNGRLQTITVFEAIQESHYGDYVLKASNMYGSNVTQNTMAIKKGDKFEIIWNTGSAAGHKVSLIATILIVCCHLQNIL